MNKSRVMRLVGFLGAAGVTAGLLGAAAAGTGAYFTDSSSGVAQGTMGTIAVGTWGGGGADSLDFTFANMLPGEANTKTVNFVNDGSRAQDVWVVFPQAYLGDHNHLTDTGLINDRGTYAEIHIKSSGVAVFDSANLNDDPVSCPSCTPLPTQLLLASNVAPGATGNMMFSYMPAAKYKNNQGMPEFYLPYKIVATQPGIAPDNALN
ncbi:MAG: hypothetical protein ACYC1E_18710 [Propionibacteriaceae bacterium]